MPPCSCTVLGRSRIQVEQKIMLYPSYHEAAKQLSATNLAPSNKYISRSAPGRLITAHPLRRQLVDIILNP
ncbi:MAG TPA: hypothetical protein ENG79_07690 [Desulfobacteraceae bacterium]|nr:hypothetical protein [Desulfobacteraceae bacterium]